MKIVIGNDHAAIELKQDMIEYLSGKNDISVADFGACKAEGIDYPDYAKTVCAKVASGEYDMGILLCGTGVGMSMAANKMRGIRAVVCSDPYSAKLSREHNNANVLCIGQRVVGSGLARVIVDAFLGASFEGGRHGGRVEKIMKIEESAFDQID